MIWIPYISDREAEMEILWGRGTSDGGKVGEGGKGVEMRTQ